MSVVAFAPREHREDNEDLQIRRARIRDTKEIIALTAQAGATLTGDALRAELSQCAQHPSRGYHCVAVQHGCVVGHAMAISGVLAQAHTATVAFVVEEQMRRQGIGGLLLADLRRWGTRVGVTRLVAVSATTNLAAAALLRSAGFICEAPVMLTYYQIGPKAVHCSQYACLLQEAAGGGESGS